MASYLSDFVLTVWNKGNLCVHLDNTRVCVCVCVCVCTRCLIYPGATGLKYNFQVLISFLLHNF